MEKFQRKIDNPFKIARKIAPLLLALLFALTACGNYTASPIPTNIPPTTELPDLSHSIMGIIFSKRNGNFICVATAVDDNIAVTARHCTDDISTKAITIVLPNKKYPAAITETKEPPGLEYVDISAIKYLTTEDLPLIPTTLSSQSPSQSVVCTTLSFDKFGNVIGKGTTEASTEAFRYPLFTYSGVQISGIFILRPTHPLGLVSGSPCSSLDRNEMSLIITNGAKLIPPLPASKFATKIDSLQKLVDELKK